MRAEWRCAFSIVSIARSRTGRRTTTSHFVIRVLLEVSFAPNDFVYIWRAYWILHKRVSADANTPQFVSWDARLGILTVSPQPSFAVGTCVWWRQLGGGAVDSKHVSMHRQGTGGRAVTSVDAANSLPVQTPTYRSVGR